MNKVLVAVAAAQRAFPELRFMQLIGNIFLDEDPYYVSDEEFVEAVFSYIKEHSK